MPEQVTTEGAKDDAFNTHTHKAALSGPVWMLAVGMMLVGTAPVSPGADALPTTSNNHHIEFYMPDGPIAKVELVLESGITLLGRPSLVGPLDEIVTAQFDIYALDPHDPVIQNLPGFFSRTVDGSLNECISEPGGPIVCRHDVATEGIEVGQAATLGDALFVAGEGCIIITWRNGNPQTTIDDIPQVLSRSEPGGACP